MPTDPPVGHPAGVDLCGWQVQATRSHGWKCNAPALHDHEHRLTLRGEVTARAIGFHHPEVQTPISRPER